MSEINETIDNQQDELSIGDRFPELKLDMDDEEILSLTKKWKDSGSKALKNIKDIWEENKSLWKGELSKDLILDPEERSIRENRTWTGLETFVPILNRQSPDPTVQSTRDQESKDIAQKVRNKLIELVDKVNLKVKLKKASRDWTIYQLGVAKVFWSSEINDIDVRIIKPENLIFQDGATIDAGMYTGEFIGEYIAKPAKEVKEIFNKEKSKKVIDSFTKEDDGTVIKYIEWHTKEYTVWEFNGHILDKIKNKDWNYDTEKKTIDEFDNEFVEQVKGFNHFSTPQIPYAFFSVYNLGDSVFDATGLIQQAKFSQDAINDRKRQINKNIKNQNNSIVLYGLDETKATYALKQLETGGALAFTNKQEQGFERVGGTPLTSDVYSDLNQSRQAIDSVMATGPITRGEESRDQTVRGKILSRQADVDRISFISTYLELFVDRIFNLMVQEMYVYYDTPQIILNLGSDYNNEVLLNREFINFRGSLLVSVKDGSLIPKDPLTEANQAVDLYGIGALDLLSLLERLDIENPKEIALRTMLYKNSPEVYLSDVLGYTPPQPEQPTPEMSQGITGNQPPQTENQNNTVVSESSLPQQPSEQEILSSVPIQ